MAYLCLFLILARSERKLSCTVPDWKKTTKINNFFLMVLYHYFKLTFCVLDKIASKGRYPSRYTQLILWRPYLSLLTPYHWLLLQYVSCYGKSLFIAQDQWTTHANMEGSDWAVQRLRWWNTFFFIFKIRLVSFRWLHPTDFFYLFQLRLDQISN